MNGDYCFKGCRRLQNMTWFEADEYLKSGGRSIIIPCGQTERRGPRLPMGSNAYIAAALADSVAEYSDSLVAPPIEVGWAPETIDYAGSVSLRADTLINVVIDACESLMVHGFERFYLISGYGEKSLPPLEISCTKLRYRTGALAAVLAPSHFGVEKQMELADGNKNIRGRACGIETAHIMYIKSRLVDAAKIRDPSKKSTPEEDRFTPYADHADYYYTPEEFKTRMEKDGLQGDASWATVERGKIIHNAIARGMADYIISSQKTGLNIKKPEPIA